MNNPVFIDTSAFYAYLDKSDKHHKSMSAELEKHVDQMITSNYITDELITLLRVRNVSFKRIRSFISSLLKGEICKIYRIDEQVDISAWEIMQKYKDQSFSFTDCTSFAVMKALEIDTVCTIDHHYYYSRIQSDT